jgi:type III secretion protein C
MTRAGAVSRAANGAAAHAFADASGASPLQCAEVAATPNLASMNSTNTTPAHTPRSSGSRFAVRMLHGLLAAALVSVAIAPATAPAATGVLGTKRFVYRADGKKLVDVLQDFAASQSLPVVIDPGVDGVVNANFNTHPEEFLDAMTRTYGVIWYFDGTTLFIYPSRSMESKVFRMRGYDRERVRQMLAALHLGDARFPLRFDDANQTLLAYGPPRHIELVSTVLEQLERDNRDRVGTSIRVVPLRYATAADRTIGNSKIGGLASTLNSLFSGSAKPSGDGAPGMPDGGVSAAGISERVRAMQANYGLGAAGGASGKQPAKRDDDGRANRLASDKPTESFDAERPFFQAEPSSNAIIVRGLPDRMKEYETLVHQLDVPQDLVEIEASIIDVSSDDFDSLGIDWTLSIDGVQRLAMTPGTPATSHGGSPTDALAGANITTLVGNAGRELLSHIRALEGKGKARVLARPKVLGAVNRTATMTDKRVASVRVAGNLDANLFSVEAGTTLSVTPQVVTYGDHREVRLSLSIQDGDFEGVSVDQVPIVKQTQIDTEATVREGESLLIGGISVESSIDGTTGIPLLSHIPLIGGVFRNHDSSRSHAERLFLLTPKIIGVGVTRAAAAPLPASAASAPAGPAPLTVPLVRQALVRVSDAGPAAAAAAPAPVATVCEAQMLGLARQCPAGVR